MRCAMLSGSVLALVAVAPAAVAVPFEVGRAYDLLQQGQVDAAISAFEAAAARFPDVIEARLGLGIAYRRAGRDQDAWNLYTELSRQAPDNILVLETLGLLATFRPEWQAAGITYLSQLLALEPTNTTALTLRATLYGFQGDFESALADYALLLRDNPSPEVIVAAAELSTYVGNTSEALRLFEQYRALGRPLELNAQLAYALALLQSDRPLEALAQIEAAGGNDPPTRIYASTLGVLSFDDPATYQDRAVAAYLAVLRQPNAEPDLLREAANFFTDIPAQQQEALALYRQLQQLDPNDTSLRIQAAALESHLLRFADADHPLIRAIREPVPFLHQETLRAELRQLLRPVMLADEFRRDQVAQMLLRLDPPDPELESFYLALLEAGVELPFLWFRIAQMRLERDDREAALAALAELDRGATEVERQAGSLLRAEVARRNEDFARAEAGYRAALLSRDDQVVQGARLGLAGLFEQLDRPQEAKRIYAEAANPNDLQAIAGQTALSLTLGEVSVAEAEAVLAQWQQRFPGREFPQQVKALIIAMPADPDRLPLYEAIASLGGLPDPRLDIRRLEAIAQRDPAQAAQELAALRERQLEAGEDLTNVTILSAQLASQRGDLATARAEYTVVLDADPRNLAALYGLAELELQAQNPAAAIAIYEQLLAAHPRETGALISLAGLHQDAGDLDLAIATYEELLRGNDDPTLQWARLGLAGLYEQENRVQEAMRLYERALTVVPNDAEIQLAQASLAYRLGELDEAAAVAVLDQWLAANPNTFPPALRSLVGALPADPVREPLYQALAATGETDNQLQFRRLELLAERNPSLAAQELANLRADLEAAGSNLTPVLLLNAQLVQGQGDFTAARADYEAVLANDPINIAALYGLADLERRSGNRQAAIDLYEQLRTAHPRETGALISVAGLYQETEQTALAIARYEEFLRLQPNDEGVLAILAGLLQQDNQLSRAANLYDQILSRSPNNAAAITGLASLRQAQGDSVAAGSLLERLLVLDPMNLSALTALANLERQQAEAGRPAISGGTNASSNLSRQQLQTLLVLPLADLERLESLEQAYLRSLSSPASR